MKRPDKILLSGLILGLAVHSVSGESWPVKLSPAGTDLISSSDLVDLRLPAPPGSGLPDLTIRVLRQAIEERQNVSATFGEPRGKGGSPPPAYLHNAVDVRAPASDKFMRSFSTQVFTITPGEVKAHEDYEDRPADVPAKVRAWNTDYESVWVGSYRYMHIRVDPDLASVYKQYRDRKVRLRLPAGTFIGRSFFPRILPPPPASAARNTRHVRKRPDEPPAVDRHRGPEISATG